MLKNLGILALVGLMILAGICYATVSDDKPFIVFVEKGIINKCNLDGTNAEVIMNSNYGEIDQCLFSPSSSHMLYSVLYQYYGHEFNKVYLTNLSEGDTEEKIVLKGDYYFGFHFLRNGDFVAAYGSKVVVDRGWPIAYHKYLAVIGGEIKRFDNNPTEHPANIIDNHSLAIFAKTGKGESNKIKIFDLYSGKSRIIKIPMTLTRMSSPVMSPNGRYLAYYVKGRNGLDAVVYDIAKKKNVNHFTMICRYPSCGSPSYPIWSKDSKTILFDKIFFIYECKNDNATVFSMVLLGTDGSQEKSSMRLYSERNDIWIQDYLTKNKILIMQEDGKAFSLYLSDFSKLHLIKKNVTSAQFCKR